MEQRAKKGAKVKTRISFKVEKRYLQSVEESKNKSIADTFNAKLKTPWVWLVLVLTIGLTILFYFSQKPQIVMYSQYIKSLSEYQLLEANLMRTMDRVRTGYGADTMLMHSQTMTLREMTVSFSRQMDELNVLGTATPPSSMTAHFEREVLSKVSGMRRYTVSRVAWLEKWNLVKSKVHELPVEQALLVEDILDSARVGFPVFRKPEMILPDSLSHEVDALFAENNDLAIAWSKFDNDVALMISVDLAQFFQMESLNEMSLKSKIPMVFYFLSLVLMLSTFFFLFRSKL